jgi:L-alanine-DL-glutamate epimerase-like enolase superfamily enzyme
VLEIDAEDEIGLGYAYATRPRHARAIQALLGDLAEALIGQPVDDIRAVWANLARHLECGGRTGIAVMALGAVDMALWDLLGKRAGMPMHRLLGAVTDRVPVYATARRGAEVDDLLDQARTCAAAGYAGFKVRLGSSDPRRDLALVERLQADLAGEIELMADAGGAWSAGDAITIGRQLAALGINWLEDPVVGSDLEGTGRVREALDLRVATGKQLFNRGGFVRLVEGRNADAVVADVVRCGGPSQFMQVATLAEAHHLPISSRAYTEVSAQLLAACANASMVEHRPGWWDRLIEEPAQVRDGAVVLSDRPGLGFEFAERTLSEFADDPVVLP